MKKYLNYFFAFSVLLVLGSCAKDEEVMTGTINGFVSDYTNANSPIAGATVTINSKGLTKTTGSDGRFEFTGLEPGTYSISVFANNFQPTTKQVTVYAGQTAVCDFQLEKGAKSIEIDPLNIVFGRTMSQASFTITNNTNGPLGYSISNYPDYIQVLPTSATISAKGKQAVGLSLINRSSITSARNAQLIVNVGSDSYIVSINVEPWADEKVNVDINPQNLSFDSNTEQLSFTMTSNNSFSNSYTLSTNLDVLTLSQESGTLQAKGQNTIAVSVKNRKEIDSSRNGQIIINMEGNTYIVSVHIDKYVEGGGGGTSQATDVTRGLQAYYTFNNSTADDDWGNFHGFLNGGSFINDTPNGNGKAVSLKKGDFISIANNPVSSSRSSTVSIWIKDFGPGNIIGSSENGSTPIWTPSIAMSKNTYFIYADRGYFKKFNVNISNYMSGVWTMVTMVTKNIGPYSATYMLYINGRLAVSNAGGYKDYTAPMLTIGGSTSQDDVDSFPYGGFMADPMKVDNVRLYNVSLTDEEIRSIYDFESK